MTSVATSGQVLLPPQLEPGPGRVARNSKSAAVLQSIEPAAAPVKAKRRFPVRSMLHPVFAVVVFAALCGLFVLVLEPWLLNWGSTQAEQAMPLPGDTADPTAYFTRAINIDRPPADVWPWLLQIGQDRAGFYSNDWLENLTTADIHNADVIRPEWQTRAVGDKIRMASPWQTQMGGEATLLTVRLLEPDRVIGDIPGRFVLVPAGDRGTRLLLREQLAIPERSGAMWLIWDPMHFVMEQRMLQGIKERVEGQPLVPGFAEGAAHLGWALAGLGLVAVFLSRRGWRFWLALPVAVGLPPLLLTGDLNAALAGFLSAGITVAGALAFGWRWWPTYLLIGSGVALVLLIAPDAYAAFGLLFLLLEAVFLYRLAVGKGQLPRIAQVGPQRPSLLVGARALASPA